MTKYLPLLKQLTAREIKARYKQSFLGYFWIILNPLFQMIILSFVFSIILRARPVGVPFPVFLYAGFLPWTLFSESVIASMGVFPGNASLLKKIYFPREVFVLSKLFSKIFDFALASLVFILLMLWFHLPFQITSVAVIAIFLIQFIFTLGLSLMLSAFNLFYRDIQYLFNLILRVWFYLTPIVYPMEIFPEKYRWFFKVNPLAVFVTSYRDCLLSGIWPSWPLLGGSLLLSLTTLAIGYFFFKRLEGMFADVV